MLAYSLSSQCRGELFNSYRTIYTPAALLPGKGLCFIYLLMARIVSSPSSSWQLFAHISIYKARFAVSTTLAYSLSSQCHGEYLIVTGLIIISIPPAALLPAKEFTC